MKTISEILIIFSTEIEGMLVLLQLEVVELVAGMGAVQCFVLVESRSSVVQEQLKQS